MTFSRRKRCLAQHGVEDKGQVDTTGQGPTGSGAAWSAALATFDSDEVRDFVVWSRTGIILNFGNQHWHRNAVSYVIKNDTRSQRGPAAWVGTYY